MCYRELLLRKNLVVLGTLIFTHISGISMLAKETEFSWTSVTLLSLIPIMGSGHSVPVLCSLHSATPSIEEARSNNALKLLGSIFSGNTGLDLQREHREPAKVATE